MPVSFIYNGIILFSFVRILLGIKTIVTPELDWRLINGGLCHNNCLWFDQLYLLEIISTTEDLIVLIKHARLLVDNRCLITSKLSLEHLPGVITLKRSFIV